MKRKIRFPGGKRKALVLSYDDGLIEDKRLVDVMNRYGIRGTFNLNSGALERSGMVQPAELKSLYQNHEVAVHTVRHPHLTTLAPEQVAAEIRDDKKALEELVGYRVRGMAYPYGEYNEAVAKQIPALGLDYARTTRSHYRYQLPQDVYRWPGTCFHLDRLLEMARYFVDMEAGAEPALFLVWGHSWELNQGDGWALMEKFCRFVGNRRDIWYATCIEIIDCLQAARADGQA